MIHHVALEIRRDDAGESERFWALLGFARVDPPAALAGRALWLERDGTQIHLLYADEPANRGEGHPALVAPEYDATVERLNAAGYETRAGERYWGAARCAVHAPGGHRVELMAAPPGAAA